MKFIFVSLLSLASALPLNASARDVCRAAKHYYTYPSGNLLYAQYYLDDKQRASDCFISQCAAVCPFPTALKVKRTKPYLVDPMAAASAPKKAASAALK